MSDLAGQRVRITTRPPHPVTIEGTVMSVVSDGKGDYAVEVATDGGGMTTAFSSLLDRIQVVGR